MRVKPSQDEGCEWEVEAALRMPIVIGERRREATQGNQLQKAIQRGGHGKLASKLDAEAVSWAANQHKRMLTAMAKIGRWLPRVAGSNIVHKSWKCQNGQKVGSRTPRRKMPCGQSVKFGHEIHCHVCKCDNPTESLHHQLCRRFCSVRYRITSILNLHMVVIKWELEGPTKVATSAWATLELLLWLWSTCYRLHCEFGETKGNAEALLKFEWKCVITTPIEITSAMHTWA